VEVFFNGSRMAAHLRKATAQRDPLVNPEHMTSEHRRYLNYNADDFMSWAQAIGKKVSAVVHHFLSNGKEAEQGYKSCASLTRLADRYGAKRLEAACARVTQITAVPTMRSISSILRTMRDDKGPDTLSAEESNRYGITRGAGYFSKGRAHND
jgi:hypothetical protein